MLDLDLLTLVFQIVNFLVLLLGLRWLLFKPLRAKIEERAGELAELRTTARDHEARTAEVQEQWQTRITMAEAEAEQIRQAALRDATDQAEAILEETRKRADHLTVQMSEELRHQHNELVVQQYDELLDTIMDVAGNVVRSVTTRRTHDDLVASLLANLYRTPPEQVDVYRKIMADRIPTAYVTTPVALTDDQTKAITDALSSLLDRRVEVHAQVAPELIAGIQVRLADKLVDNSVRQELTRIRANARAELLSRIGAEH